MWADSFHEGNWACVNLAKLHDNLEEKNTTKTDYCKGFIPVYRFFVDNLCILEITVYGSYNSWSPLPSKVQELLSWGKPDFLAYCPLENKILFAVEETAAVPTGNQALQRCDRLYGSARERIPFWYLLAEYGTHKDGGVRRDSIWPSIMAIKLSVFYKTPSIILHYSDKENPEGYDFGEGVNSLFKALTIILENFGKGLDTYTNIRDEIESHYFDMLRFIESQASNITVYIPGQHHFDNKNLPERLASMGLDLNDSSPCDFYKEFPDFLKWPTVSEWQKQSGIKAKSIGLIKYDEFAQNLEKSIDSGKSYILGTNAGSRPQNATALSEWIEKQNSLTRKVPITPAVKDYMNLNDFPKSESGNRHVTTAKNIIYLFDRFSDVKKLIESSFHRLSDRLPELDHDALALVYISNSVKPGRIFGDPFTGQISAYSSAFGKFDNPKRLVIAYYPHQSYTQIIDSKQRKVKNKGLVLLREMCDLIIFSGGVAVTFNDEGRGVAI